jgi:hypothetical protein
MDLSTLPPIEYASRADAVRLRLAERDLAALAVTDMNNIRWLTGFTGSSGIAVLLPNALVLVTDGRYADRASAELAAAGVEADIRIGFTQPQQHDLFLAACAGTATSTIRTTAAASARIAALPRLLVFMTYPPLTLARQQSPPARRRGLLVRPGRVHHRGFASARSSPRSGEIRGPSRPPGKPVPARYNRAPTHEPTLYVVTYA